MGGGLYYEYRTNDSRLTIEVLKTAVTNFKVKAINYAKVVKLNYQHEFIEGLEFIDNLDKKKFQVFGKIIINATGPWVDDIRIMDHSMNNKSIVHSKGVHIVLPHTKLPLEHAVYFDVKDGRMIFAIPAEGITYVGTTDTFYKEDIENPSITNDDIAYLLNTIPQIFKIPIISKKDIISAWSGVRPLIFETGKKAGELSRHDEVFVSKSGMITIAGGKLTGYRLMAEKTIDQCAKKVFPNLGSSNTASMHLSGGNFESEGMMLQELNNFIKEYKSEKVAADKITQLFYKYGTNTITILENASKSNLSILKAELLYCLEQEMVVTLSDFMFRRTSYALFSPGEFAETEIDEILEYIRDYFNYSSENIAEQKSAYYEQINWWNQDI